ncbi:MAG: amino acid permease [Candidatus Woesearchaeota archaeon]|nr:amino acid permease [Candidatus Woesearchaeota archaeon]
MAELKRTLGLFDVTVASVGIILGAGIYALIGLAAQSSGNATWLSFLITAVIAIFTGLSYAELSSMFKGDAGEYDYLHAAFNKPFAFVMAFSMICAGFISAATVSLGFAGYISNLFPIPVLTGAVLLVLVMTFINFIGIQESNKFNMISTFIEFIGLAIIVVLGIPKLGSVNYLAMPYGFSGVFSSAALVFFAYMGFESIIKLREETKNPSVTIPKALVYSILITSVLYVLVAMSAVSIVDWQVIAASEAPLATVAQAVLGSNAFTLLAIIALFSTSNTVLITLVTTSRMIYGMAKEKTLPAFLAEVHPTRKTPHLAILVLMLLTLAFVLIGDIGLVANLTNFFLFATFASVNLSLIVLRYKCKQTKRSFRCPGNIGQFSIIAFLGFLSSLFMLLYVVKNLLGF